MQTIDIDQAAAEDVLVGIALAVPPDVELGRPRVALAEGDGCVQVLTTSGTWWLEPGGVAARLVPLDAGRELCRWRDGVEIERTLDLAE